jgi:hypothetical protein
MIYFGLVLKLEISYYYRVMIIILKDFLFLLEDVLKIIIFLHGEIFEFP